MPLTGSAQRHFVTRQAGNDAIDAAIEAARQRSVQTCELCGKPGALGGSIHRSAPIDAYLRVKVAKTRYAHFQLREADCSPPVSPGNYLLTLFAASNITFNTSFGLESIAT